MKKKTLNYFLIASVVFVWGLIIYKIVAAYADHEPDEQSLPQHKKKEAYNDYALPKDTSHLLLKYRDPFGIVKQKDTSVAAPRTSDFQRKAIPRVAMNWDFIRYVGYIRNPVSKKLVAMVRLNSNELMMNEGEQNGDIRLIKNLRDSIKISYQGKMKFIPLKPATP